MLERLGLTPTQAEVYLALLDVSDGSAPELRQVLPHLSPARLRATFMQLVEMGFLTGDRHRFSAVPPDVAVSSTIQRRKDDAAIVTNLLPVLTQRFWEGRQDARNVDFIEMVTTREQIAERWAQLDTLAQKQVRAFDCPPYVTVPTEPNIHEIESLKRGVVYRVIYSQEAVDIPGRWSNLLLEFEAGERARVTESLPCKLTLFDEFAAIVSLHGGDDRSPATVMIVYRSPLLSALQQLFESAWERSISLSDSEAPSSGSDEGSALARMLAAGLSDATIHRTLGVSPSTVHRRIKALYSTLGAKSRFQAGYLFAIQRR